MEHPLLPEGFVLTAHRGAVDRAPENTILAFQAAEELGFDACELDLQLTSDGVAVLCHDLTLKRCSLQNSEFTSARINDLTFEQVRSIDLGLGQRVPTFDEVLDATTVRLQVELKEPSVALAAAEVLRQRNQSDRDRCVVTSFHPLALREFGDAGQGLSGGRGLLVWDVFSDYAYLVQSLQVSTLLLHWPGLTREIVADWQGKGYEVFASMFNNAGELRNVIETGVQGTSTDRPMLAMSLLDELAAGPGPR